MDKVVDYLVFEQSQIRAERAHRRSFIIILVLIVALIGTNAGWVYYESGNQDIVTTIEAEQDGSGTNYVSGGDISYGAESQDNNTNESEKR